MNQRPNPGAPRRRSGSAAGNSPRAGADYARRREEYLRRRAYEEKMERRRREKRERAVRVFLGRTLVFAVIFAVLAAAVGIGFWVFFNKTDPEPSPSVVRYSYGGKEAASLPADEAYRGGVLYIDLSAAAGYLGMTEIGGAGAMRFVLAADAADSEGEGREEEAVFHDGSDLAEVNGQSVRLEAPAVLSGEHYLIPVSFLTNYITGVAVETTANSVSISRTFTEEVQDEIAFALKSTAAVEPLPEDTGLPNTPYVEPPKEEEMKVTFKTDLSAYEQYMNPEDRDGYLILVNNSSTIDESYKPDDLTAIADTRKDGRAAQMMRKTAAMALEAMFIELRAAGYTDVSVTSAYRSYAYQSSLFNTYTANEQAKNPSLTLAEAQAITATYSARPGTSEHQTGLCCDMHNLPAADQAFAKKEAYTWLCDNAWKFGFILRFPEGKEDITEISFEPWHYRFVGRYHAKAIHDAGLCLEEYIEALGN